LVVVNGYLHVIGVDTAAFLAAALFFGGMVAGAYLGFRAGRK
jgi:hypothetical protein